MPTEINSVSPFYPILIPNTPYVFLLHIVCMGSQGVPKMKKKKLISARLLFFIKAKITKSFFVESASRGV